MSLYMTFGKLLFLKLYKCLHVHLSELFLSVRRKSNEELLTGYLRAGYIILIKKLFFFQVN